jgi:hypothetical protein
VGCRSVAKGTGCWLRSDETWAPLLSKKKICPKQVGLSLYKQLLCGRPTAIRTSRPCEIPTNREASPPKRGMAPSLVVSARKTLAVTGRSGRRRRMVVACSNGAGPPPKLVTFLGKGGSGKTTAAAVAAQVINCFIPTSFSSSCRWKSCE